MLPRIAVRPRIGRILARFSLRPGAVRLLAVVPGSTGRQRHFSWGRWL